MRPKEILYLLGLRPRPRSYGYEIQTFDLPVDGLVQYAQWLHPGETRKYLSQEFIGALRRFLAPGDVAIDIGAHTGDTTVPIALAVGKAGCVLALEPNRYVFPVLQRNSELNPEKTNIIPLMLAAAPSDGVFEFEYSDAGFCNGGFHEGISRWRHGHAFKLKVQGRNLLALLQAEYPALVPRVRYLKVDAEGYDFAILRSLEGLIAERRPYLMAEVFNRTGAEQRRQMYRFLAGHGYRVYRVEDPANYRGALIQEDDMTTWRQFDVFCVPELAGEAERAHGGA
ncbi:MAG: FkbM family methyltransferase [Gemmatimonadales bacterium]